MALFELVGKQVAIFCMNENTNEEKGLHRVIDLVRKDIRQITGKDMELCVLSDGTLPQSIKDGGKNLIIAGTLGDSDCIDQLIKDYQIDISKVEGKRECYQLEVIEANKQKILLIIGSEQRGTFYGLLHISELCGVTPWGYFADVVPKKREVLQLDQQDLVMVSKEPSIRLRGFFMNDEWPSLGNFVTKTFGGFNEKFYEKIFELLLRMKGNFIWPAMWTGAFPVDGASEPHANAKLAAEFGVIMGTSHHEPMMRASEEWDKVKSDSNEIGYGKDWNYFTNSRGLHEYWNDSTVRNKEYPNLITLGMRGERDSLLLGEDASLKQNIQLLKDVIIDQKGILKAHNMEDYPQVLALYKEVEDYFYGSKEVEGLNKWNVLDDVMFLLSDDNYGNTRTLPIDENRFRKAGWGLYYHFDYHGGPISYEWINSTPLTKAWEQLSMAYDYGIRDLWIVNVGDLRPQELPLSYFMELAYDFEKWGSSAPNKTAEYLHKWTNSIFGDFIEEDTVKDIEKLLDGYTRMNGRRRPEVVYPETFHCTHEREALKELTEAKHLEEEAKRIYEVIPQEILDSYIGLVYFPVMATANLRKMNIYAGYNAYFAKTGCILANRFAQLTKQCIEEDQRLEHIYNKEMAHGKWDGMMLSKHVCFHNWNDEGSSYPEVVNLQADRVGKMLVYIEGYDEPVTEGHVAVVLRDTDKSGIQVLVSGTERENGILKISNEDMITLMENEIIIKETKVGEYAKAFEIQADFSTVESEIQAPIVIEYLGQKVTLDVTLNKELDKIRNITSITEGTFVEQDQVIAMEAINYEACKGIVDKEYGNVSFEKLENYGRGLGTMKVYPTLFEAATIEQAPSLTYKFYIQHSGNYTCRFHFIPSNNRAVDKGLLFGVQFDDKEAEIKNTLPDIYAAGDYNDPNWCQYVLDNVRYFDTSIELSEGLHHLTVYGLDAGIGLQKVELFVKDSNTYYGYEQTYRV